MWGLRYGLIFSLVSHCRVATKRSILHSLLATGLVLALSSMFAPQTVGAVSEGSLHPSWSDSAMAEGWRAVCGDVRNVGQVPARSVAIRVQGLGSTGQVVSTRDHYVLADVPAGSRSVFCVPMPAGATSYNVDGPPRRLGIRGGAVGNPALDAGGAPWTTVSVRVPLDARGVLRGRHRGPHVASMSCCACSNVIRPAQTSRCSRSSSRSLLAASGQFWSQRLFDDEGCPPSPSGMRWSNS